VAGGPASRARAPASRQGTGSRVQASGIDRAMVDSAVRASVGGGRCRGVLGLGGGCTDAHGVAGHLSREVQGNARPLSEVGGGGNVGHCAVAMADRTRTENFTFVGGPTLHLSVNR
jgi:hypothetical protein